MEPHRCHFFLGAAFNACAQNCCSIQLTSTAECAFVTWGRKHQCLGKLGRFFCWGKRFHFWKRPQSPWTKTLQTSCRHRSQQYPEHGHCSWEKRGPKTCCWNGKRFLVCRVWRTWETETTTCGVCGTTTPKWATACADGGHWVHPGNNETYGFAILIDEGSRFRAAHILCQEKKQTMSARRFLCYFQEGWTQYFGNPKTLRLESGWCF